jgi:hypothetical protein
MERPLCEKTFLGHLEASEVPDCLKRHIFYP